MRRDAEKRYGILNTFEFHARIEGSLFVSVPFVSLPTEKKVTPSVQEMEGAEDLLSLYLGSAVLLADARQLI